MFETSNGLKTTKQTAKEKFENSPEALLKRGLELQDEISERKAELDKIKEWFADFLPKQATESKFVCQIGQAKLTISNSYEVKPDSVAELKKIFKADYKLFVSLKESFGATAALKQILKDGDRKDIDVIRDSVLIKTSKSVKLEATNN